MGVFGTGILDNDSAMDVYYIFEERYFLGQDLAEIKAETLIKLGLTGQSGNPILHDNTNGWLAYSLACWECQVLDAQTLGIIEKIYAEEIDAENWEGLWEERKKAIAKHLKKIAKPASKIKPIPKFITPKILLKVGECFSFTYPNGKYGGAICLDITAEDNKPARYVVGITRIHTATPPTVSDFLNSYFLVYNYGMAMDGRKANWINRPEPKIRYSFTGKLKLNEDEEMIKNIKKDLQKNTTIGFVDVTNNASTLNKSGSMSFDFSYNHENQFAWEESHPESIDYSYPVSQFCKVLGD